VTFAIGFLAYAIVGLVVLGGLRGCSGLRVSDNGDLFAKWALWPGVLCIALFVGRDQ